MSENQEIKNNSENNENSHIEVETNFKSVFSNPKRMFGFVYLFFIIGVVLVGRYYIRNVDNISNNSAMFAKIEEEKKAEDIPQKGASTQAGIDVNVMSKSTPELVAKGKELFTANCASCHGDNGDGKGPAGAALNPKPRNYHEKEGWTNGRKFSDMYKTLEEGIIKNGMNSFSQLPVTDRFALIHYIRTFATDFPEVKEDEVSDMNLKYSLAAGKATNAQIPIAKSTSILAKENVVISDKVTKMIDFVTSHKDDERVIIFNKVTANPKKVLTFLNNSQTWKSNTENFVKLVQNTVPVNGFNGKVANISRDEMQKLHNLLSSLYSM